MDIICPILKTSGNCPPGNDSESSDSAPADTVVGSDEGYIQVKNTRVYGLRTYSIVLIIVLVYAYLCIKTGDALGMKDLALMACGFLFGVKSVRKGS